MPECHAGAKWGDLGRINTLFMLALASMKGSARKGFLERFVRLNRFPMSPTYYGGNRI